jgi:hypothetical protein
MNGLLTKQTRAPTTQQTQLFPLKARKKKQKKKL